MIMSLTSCSLTDETTTNNVHLYSIITNYPISIIFFTMNKDSIEENFDTKKVFFNIKLISFI